MNGYGVDVVLMTPSHSTSVDHHRLPFDSCETGQRHRESKDEGEENRYSGSVEEWDGDVDKTG